MEAKRRRLYLRLGVPAGLCLTLAGCWACMISMPGRSWSGPLPQRTEREAAIELSLRRDVGMLAGTIGVRNLYTSSKLAAAEDYLQARFKESGFVPAVQEFTTSLGPCRNIEVEIRGARVPSEIVIVGAHYDSAYGSPGANDNGTGTAALLALAPAFARATPARTLRFVAFVNEEPPFFQTGDMGSRVYARRCRERGENVAAMLSLETIGCFSDDDGSQKYPFPVGLFYPSRGNFIAFVGNLGSRSLVRRAIASFRSHAQFPSEGAALPSWIPGIGWSDHASFWEEGYAAVMITDTAPFRYGAYHTARDTPDKIDYEKCARVVAGVERVIQDLVDR